MLRTITLTAGLAAATALSGCMDTVDYTADTTRPSPAEAACLSRVKSETGNYDAVVLSNSGFSEAGTKIIVGIGPQRAPWECFYYTDGSTSRPMSLTNEGAA